MLLCEWGGMNKCFYCMFYSIVLLIILCNFDCLLMVYGVEVCMFFMDWCFVIYMMVFFESSKYLDGVFKVVVWCVMIGLMLELICMVWCKVGFNLLMLEWLNGLLVGWIVDLIDWVVLVFVEFVDEVVLCRKVVCLFLLKLWDWEMVGWFWLYLNMKWMLVRYL